MVKIWVKTSKNFGITIFIIFSYIINCKTHLKSLKKIKKGIFMAYEIILPSIPFIVGYLGTYSLYRRHFIKKSIHVNLWNLIIGIAFLISAGGGFLLLILMELGVTLPINFGLMYSHVELGITLALVAVFHHHVYLKGTKRMLFGNRMRVSS